MSGKLILCGTPIGNLEDLSPRAERVLAEADVIACEDTRRTRKLLAHSSISAARLVVYNEANERRRVPTLVAEMMSGRTVVLVSDAGMPGLSDPGFRLVAACVEAGVVVETVPGPSAAISALAVSGLPPARFVFEGFLPRKRGDRQKRIALLSHEERTMIFYESPHRIEETLEDLAAVIPDRRAALARELTKMYEEVRRGTLAELLAGVRSEGPRGEIVLVVAGAVGEGKVAAEPADLARRARALMDGGTERKEALSLVAQEAGVPRRDVFNALLEFPDGEAGGG
ncbi:MAG TPA: 16S rRNA (cytidine(1402)-2'-O)-methyltransferase [Actinomycetota bacterium]|nr:16S rRNA (cytidine(1402)-2'-O)-methyltransferase [Actinomycetota bacterium]